MARGQAPDRAAVSPTIVDAIIDAGFLFEGDPITAATH
jgi:hypothetical protein